MSDDRHCASVRLPESLNDAIEEELDYGDSKDSWIREACRRRLDEDRSDAVDAPPQQ